MAPRIHNTQLETRTARLKLKPRRKPYPARVAPGVTLGYRRNQGVGTWSAIVADGASGSWMKRLAWADDQEDANGKEVMTYWEAQDAARKLARATDGLADGDRPASVAEAIEAYRLDLAARGGNEWNATGLIPKLTPALLAKLVSQLTKKDVIGFRNALVASGIVAATVNRYMTQFVAALNHAAALDDRITNTKAWTLEILPAARNARRIVLSDDKVLAIVAAGYRQTHEWGLVVDVLAETGTRISQALRLDVMDLLPGDRLDMPVSRKGKGQKVAEKKPVPITPALAAKLRRHAARRKSGERLLVDGGGKPWASNCQNKLFPDTVKATGLDSSITSYALRHSSIARQLLAGVPAAVVASNHDTSIKEIQAHYAKYITDVSDTVTRRALLGTDPPPPAPPPLPVAANDNAYAQVAVR
jgi:integrase